jgi:splicing factor U2AF subunit
MISRRIPKPYANLLDRFCNFMHLSHPTKSLESSLEHSQRLERRKQASGGGRAGGNAPNLPPVSNLGWVPPSLQQSAPEGGAGGWQPSGGNGDHYGESWKPGM